MFFKILGGAILFPFLLAFSVALFILSWIGDLITYPKLIRDFNKLPIEDSHKLQALLSFNEARRKDWKTRIYDTFAPLVTYYALCFTKWEANKLPGLFSKWDNNVSLNGDSGGVFYKGEWVNFYDVDKVIPGGWPEANKYVQATYDSEAFNGSTYYSWSWIPKKWRHPRNFIQRWIWIGFRNRASDYAMKMGYEIVKETITDASGQDKYNLARNEEGYFLLVSGTHYMFRTQSRFFKWMIIRSIGYKLNIVYHDKTGKENIAAVVNIPFSAKRIKE